MKKLIAILILAAFFACKKKEPAPAPAPTPAPGPAPTDTTQKDTITRVLKTYEFRIKTYCERVSAYIRLDNDNVGASDSSWVKAVNKDTLRVIRATKMRYLKYSLSSLYNTVNANGQYIPCQTGDFTLWINGKVYLDTSGVSSVNGLIDLYK